MVRMDSGNTLFLGKGKLYRLLIPYVTYTSPEFAHVGLQPEEMRQTQIRRIWF